jgi:hypothetical protein
MKIIEGFVAHNEGEYDLNNMSFDKSDAKLLKMFGKRQKISKIILIIDEE